MTKYHFIKDCNAKPSDLVSLRHMISATLEKFDNLINRTNKPKQSKKSKTEQHRVNLNKQGRV